MISAGHAGEDLPDAIDDASLRSHGIARRPTGNRALLRYHASRALIDAGNTANKERLSSSGR